MSCRERQLFHDARARRPPPCCPSEENLQHQIIQLIILRSQKCRFGASSLHQRDSRSALFAGYTGDQSQRGRPSPSPSPSAGVGGGYGYNSYSPSNGNSYGGTPSSAYRTATPNKKGQYSDAVLNELESQNDEQVAGILGKVKVLKDVSQAMKLSEFCTTSLERLMRLGEERQEESNRERDKGPLLTHRFCAKR
jgi:hypothetical protein